MPSRRLDTHFINNGLICPENLHKIEYTDENRTGLYIEVRSTSPGQGTYWYRFKGDNGRTARIKLGRTTDISLKDAKTQVQTLRARRQLGEDIAGEERKRRQSPTWNEFFDNYYLPHVKQHKRSWANDEEMHRLRIKKRFGDQRLKKISRHEVQRFHGELKDFGLAAATADHYLKLIRQALNLAMDWNLLEKNPVARVRLFNEDNREERMMTEEQLQQLIATLDQAGERRRTAAQVIKFLLFTGARVNEALSARWDDINLAGRNWTIQARTAKGKRRRTVPLNDAALEVLDHLESRGQSEWLFTSSRKDDSGARKRMTTINKVWQQLRVQAGLPWLRLHDLRHHFSSALVNSGRTLYEVQQILGHSDSKVTERYAHLSTARLQDAANSAGQFLEDALEKTVD